MNGDERRDPLRDLWQSQGSEHFQISIEEIRMRIEKIERRVRRMRLVTFGVCTFLIAFFGWWAGWWTSERSNVIERIGAAMVVAAVAYLAWQVNANRSRLPAVADRTADHLRAELLRQRDFHSGRRFWSRMAFLTVAGTVFFTGFAVAHPEVRRTIVAELIAFGVLTVLAVPLNLRQAAKYQRELDRVDRMSGEVS